MISQGIDRPKGWLQVNFAPAVAYHFCQALPATFAQLGPRLLAGPCSILQFQACSVLLRGLQPALLPLHRILRRRRRGGRRRQDGRLGHGRAGAHRLIHRRGVVCLPTKFEFPAKKKGCFHREKTDCRRGLGVTFQCCNTCSFPGNLMP